jgi:hypothetical protein
MSGNVGLGTNKGSWNALTNAPAISNSTQNNSAGDYYTTSVAGTSSFTSRGKGQYFAVGDIVVFNGAVWTKNDQFSAEAGFGTPSNWKDAYDNHITSGTFANNIITLNQRDGGSFTIDLTGVGGSSVLYRDSVTVSASSGQNAFTLSASIDHEDKTQVFIDGVYQQKTAYSVSGTSLTFDNSVVVPQGSTVEIISFSSVALTESLANAKIFVGDANANAIARTVSGDATLANTGALTLNASAKTTLGLNNLDNTSDANKPVSTATQTALDLKSNIASPTFTGTVGGITKAMVGLSNVDNTTDAGKPVSTATQSALDLKANLAGPTFTGNTSAANLTLSGYLRGPASFVIDPSAHGDITGTVVIAGNLQVDGTQTTINSTTVSIDDLNLTLASGASSSSAANGAGITIDGASASLSYISSVDSFKFNKNLGINTNASYPLHVSGNIIAVEDSAPALRLIGGTTSFDLKSDGGVFKVRDVSGGNELYHIAAGGSGYHDFYINDSFKMRLNSSGNLGIGTTSPSSKLHIRTSTNFNYEFEEVSSKLRLSALNDARSANVPLQFAASEFNFITGEATFSNKLSVSQSGADMIDLTRSSVGTYRLAISSSDAFSVFDVGANADRFVISSGGAATFSGNVNVGSTLSVQAYSSLATLELIGRTGSGFGGGLLAKSSIYSETSGAQYSANLVFKTNNSSNSLTERLRLNYNGDAIFSGDTEIITSSTPTLQLTQSGSTNYKGYIKLAGNDLEIRGSSGAMEFYNGSVNGNSSALRLSISSAGLATFQSSTQGKIKLIASSNEYLSLEFANSSGTTQWEISKNNTHDLYFYKGGYRMMLKAGGNVGIGETNPVNKLEVNGLFAAPLTSGSAQNGIARFSQTSGDGVLDIGFGDPYTWLQSRNSSTYATSYNLALNPNGGKVGIGTTAPDKTLTVGSTSQATTGIDIYTSGGKIWEAEQYYSNEGYQGMYYAGTRTIQFRANNVSYFNGGNVGIGTTSPTRNLDVNGEITHGGLVMKSGNGIHLDRSLVYSRTINIVAHNWVDTGIYSNSGSHQLGESGTYAVQIYSNSHGGEPYWYAARWSGIMSWYQGSVNQNSAFPIPLTTSAHSTNGRTLELRIQNTLSSGPGTPVNNARLEVKSNAYGTNSVVLQFTFRRLI